MLRFVLLLLGTMTTYFLSCNKSAKKGDLIIEELEGFRYTIQYIDKLPSTKLLDLLRLYLITLATAEAIGTVGFGI